MDKLNTNHLLIIQLRIKMSKRRHRIKWIKIQFRTKIQIEIIKWMYKDKLKHHPRTEISSSSKRENLYNLCFAENVNLNKQSLHCPHLDLQTTRNNPQAMINPLNEGSYLCKASKLNTKRQCFKYLGGLNTTSQD